MADRPGILPTAQPDPLAPNGQARIAERSEAEQWLLELLKDGSIPASQIFKDAEECGIIKDQVRRAKAKL